MSSHLKHHHAGASQKLAQPIVKAFTDDSSVGEHGCCPITDKIFDEIVSHTYDFTKKTVPQYDTEAFKEHLVEFIKKHYPHCAEGDASKSDEKIIEKKPDEATTKERVYVRLFRRTLTSVEEEINHRKAHGLPATREHLHEIKAELEGEFTSHLHEFVRKCFPDVDEVTYKIFEEGESDFSEFATYVDEEIVGPSIEALRKLVEQVAFRFIIQVVNKREERKEKKKRK
ncbi:hypothetical protein V8C34DRAFT_266127 [Trichoderma compactum]